MEAGLGDVATDIGSPPPEAVPTLITLIGNDSPEANNPYKVENFDFLFGKNRLNWIEHFISIL